MPSVSRQTFAADKKTDTREARLARVFWSNDYHPAAVIQNVIRLPPAVLAA